MEKVEDYFLEGNAYELFDTGELYVYRGDGKGVPIGGGSEVCMTLKESWSPVTPIRVRGNTPVVGTPSIRTFGTGANRNSDEGKLDFEGFLSPTVLQAYAEYMHENRQLEDGTLRDSDNWQKGIPIDAYMKSMWRHFFDVWSRHRGVETKEDQTKNLCALAFNVLGMLHETLKLEDKNED